MAGKRTKNSIVFPVIILLVLAGLFYLSSKQSYSYFTLSPTTTSATASSNTLAVATSTPADQPEVIIDNVPIAVDLSITNAQIQQGLSGRPTLGTDDGMLFLFTKPAIYRFWMPNMNFPLDMIWINNNKIVDISADVPTTFDPAHPIFYTPKVPAQYVLEVNAHFSKNNGIGIGDTVTFENIPFNEAVVK